MGGTFIPFIDTGGTYIPYVAEEIIKYPSLKTDIVIGMTNFEYPTLFVLPRLQTMQCYRHLSQNYTFRGGWVKN